MSETLLVQPATRERFEQLADRWRLDRGPTSSITELAMHSAYQEIIGMGPAAIPFLLSELAKEPDHWFWALRCITGVDPVSDEHRGNLREMTRCWLDWGRQKGLVA